MMRLSLVISGEMFDALVKSRINRKVYTIPELILLSEKLKEDGII
jgi:hypothetical protein